MIKRKATIFIVSIIFLGFFIFYFLNFNKSSPNILFIVLDAARADHFSCYGYKKTTENMDAISRKGAIFLNHFSNAQNTLTSLPKMLFSRYYSPPIFQSNFWDWEIKLETQLSIFDNFDEEQILLPELLSLNGYKTAIFSNHSWFTKQTYLVQKFKDSFYSWPGDIALENKLISETIDWLKKNKDQKFFLYLHIMSPHTPYIHDPLKEGLLLEENQAKIDAVKDKIKSRKNDKSEGWKKNELKILRGLYDSNLKGIDRQIGRIYKSLEEFGLDRKTLIIITSDHGENLGQHNDLWHSSLEFDSLLHIPLIMVYPSIIPSNVKVNGLTESVDIMPTILDICRLKLPQKKSLDGISLLEFIKNPEKGKKAVFTENSIRTRLYKYIINQDLLFRVIDDPDEKNARDFSIKKELKTQFTNATKSYKTRHEDARRKVPPSFSFYFPIGEFTKKPIDAFSISYNPTQDLHTFLKTINPRRPWHINMHWSNFGLAHFPESGDPRPINLSCNLPNGSYDVLILMDYYKKIPLDPKEIGFQFRFSQKDPFSYPNKYIPYPIDKKGHYYFYIELGKTAVSNEKFKLEIDFDPYSKEIIVIRHIKFIPAGVKTDKIKRASEAELKKRKESLKALGYIK